LNALRLSELRRKDIKISFRRPILISIVALLYNITYTITLRTMRLNISQNKRSLNVGKVTICESSAKNRQLVGAKPTRRVGEIRSLMQGVEYRNQPEVLMDHMIKDPSISDGAYRLFQLIYKDGFFDDLFSISRAKKSLAKDLNTSVSSINRRLKELSDAGYINIVKQRTNGEWLPSRISVDLPSSLVQALEEAPIRRKVIAKCGTVAKESQSEEESTQGIEGDVTGERGVHSPVRLTPYIYNINKNNNNIDRDLASGKPQISSEPNSSVVFVSSVNQSFCQQIGSQARASEQKTQHSVGYVMQRGCAVGAGDSPSSSIGLASSGDDGVNFFDLVDDVVDEGKVREIAKNQQQIDKWQSELANMPKLQDVEGDWARYFDVSRKRGDYESWVRIAKARIEVLEKSAKKEPIKLSNGKRRLSDHDCQKLNGVLVDAYKTKKITMSEARKTLRSMVDAVLCGYYCQENVDVAKSVNSVIKKFRSDEWVNSGIVGKDKLSRPHPGWFDPEKYKVNSTRGL
jgi:hypothetical protein